MCGYNCCCCLPWTSATIWIDRLIFKAKMFPFDCTFVSSAGRKTCLGTILCACEIHTYISVPKPIPRRNTDRQCDRCCCLVHHFWWKINSNRWTTIHWLTFCHFALPLFSLTLCVIMMTSYRHFTRRISQFYFFHTDAAPESQFESQFPHRPHKYLTLFWYYRVYVRYSQFGILPKKQNEIRKGINFSWKQNVMVFYDRFYSLHPYNGTLTAYKASDQAVLPFFRNITQNLRFHSNCVASARQMTALAHARLLPLSFKCFFYFPSVLDSLSHRSYFQSFRMR